jgi:hypothetical protein
MWAHPMSWLADAVHVAAIWYERVTGNTRIDRLYAHQHRLPRLKIPNSAFNPFNVESVVRRRALSLPMALTSWD